MLGNETIMKCKRNSVKKGSEFQNFELYFFKDFSEIVDLNLVPNLILVSLKPVN